MKLKLTPVTRLLMSMDNEMSLDKQGIFNEDLRKQYLQTLQGAEKQRDAILKSLFWIDGLLAVLLSGQKLKIPTMDLTVSELPMFREILTLGASLAFLFTAIFFLNAMCYSLVVDKFAHRKAEVNAIDPDFISAADKYFHFAIKIFSPKLNTWGVDFCAPNAKFKFFAATISFLINAIFVLFPVVHFCLVAFSLYQTLISEPYLMLALIYFATCICINLLAVALWVGSSTDFEFDVLQPASANPPTKETP
jgi:hypothetical protein